MIDLLLGGIFSLMVVALTVFVITSLISASAAGAVNDDARPFVNKAIIGCGLYAVPLIYVQIIPIDVVVEARSLAIGFFFCSLVGLFSAIVALKLEGMNRKTLLIHGIGMIVVGFAGVVATGTPE